jgi:2-polyprenyl-3-methyl-5-hydroxy-6-metoxy-1,4-benzoquinol methylase
MQRLYDDHFYNSFEEGSLRSAEEVVPSLLKYLQPHSVLDVGCAHGVWLSIWLTHGVDDVMGIDGAHIDVRKLIISSSKFVVLDLEQHYDLGRRFDLVMALGIAEYLPPAAAANFVASLCRHGDMVLFASAEPEADGEFFSNRQPAEYWRGLFVVQGYQPFDFVRPLLMDNQVIEPRYRRNTMLYVNSKVTPLLPQAIQSTAVATTEKIRRF